MVTACEELDAASRAAVAAYWWRRAQGELTSWVGFRHVLDDLRVEGAPAPLLALAERSVADEYRHAVWCRDWARRFGLDAPDEIEPRDERPVTFRGASEEDNRLLRIALCCLTETVGCFTLRHVRPHVRDPELRKLNQRHTADELQHSRVGWGYLATLSAHRAAVLREWVPELLKLLPRICCDGPERDRDDLIQFGYFTPGLLRAAHDDAVREIILPGLGHLGITGAT